MLVFESLNCILCKEPFARKANEPRSPRTLRCGLAMCHECFVKEKAQEKEDRKHHCQSHDCLSNPHFANFLIGVLADKDALTLLPMERGYTLAKPFKMLKCSFCRHEYSTESARRQPFALYCNHVLCRGCFLKLRVDSETKLGYDDEIEEFIITCRICNKKTVTGGERSRNRLHDFLDELPKMTEQLKITMPQEAFTNTPTCDDCDEKETLGCIFYCSPCDIKICGSCAFWRHCSHDVKKVREKAVTGDLDKVSDWDVTIDW